MIRIMTGGPLGANKYEFKGQEGSAMAVAKAIQFLSTELFAMAVKRDHELHQEGIAPEGGYAGFFPPTTDDAEPETPEAAAVRAAENQAISVDDDLEAQRDAVLANQPDDVKNVIAEMEAQDE